MATPRPKAATTSCPANIRETQIAFGFVPQDDLETANAIGDIWSVTKTNATLSVVDLSTEDDSADIGKGDEFPTQNFPTSASTAVAIEKYCTSEFMAWLFCFALGKATVTTAAAGFRYDATPQDPATDCINMKPFTYAELIRPEPDSVIDRALIGMVVNDFTISMESGPGRNNCRVSVNCLGTGRVESPSTLVPIPPVTVEHLLNANGTAVLTINGIDYILGGSFISLTFNWNNNTRTDSGYYPGSGEQNGFGVRGRMEFNTRTIALTFTARAQKGSVEFNNLLNQVEGPTTITVKGGALGTGAGNHDMTISCPRTVMSAVINGDTDGIVNVQCTAKIMTPTDGVTPIITLSATTTKGGIFGLTPGATVLKKDAA
jgi:hypothetical protein